MGHVLLVCSCLEQRDAVYPTASAPLPKASCGYSPHWYNKSSPRPVGAGRSHPKGSKLEQVGPYFWHSQPT